MTTPWGEDPITSTERLKIPFALDADTREVRTIQEVENGLRSNTVCPACSDRLVAKNAGDQITHHFAHHTTGAECLDWLLETAKQVIMHRLRKAWEKGEQVPLEWRCQECDGRCLHTSDLSEHGASVDTRLEIRPSGAVPDVTILNRRKAPVSLIDIVDRTKPVNRREEYTGATRLPVTVLAITTTDDLERLHGGTLEAAGGGNRECQCPWCPRCDERRVCGENENCVPCTEEDERLKVPWGIPEPDEKQERPCTECDKPPDRDAAIGTYYTRCSCCINAILAQVGMGCYNDMYDHRHCRTCSVEIISYDRKENPQRLYCGPCLKEKRHTEDKRPGRETAKPVKTRQEENETSGEEPGEDDESEEEAVEEALRL